MTRESRRVVEKKPSGPVIAEEKWTAFIDNLSKRISRDSLKELCSHHGKVVGVYIPFVNRKPKYKFSTFAFVHFASSSDLETAIIRLNKAKVDGKIIVVSKAKYPGYDRKHISVGKSAEKGSRSVDQGIGVGKSDTAKLVNPVFVDSRSYRDVLLGNSKPKVPAINLDKSEKLSSLPAKPHSPLDIHIPKKTMTWINFSLVGVLKKLYELDFVQKALLSDGIKAKLARWGNMSNSCILSFESDKELEEAWRLKKEALVF
ncbi:hypothetical protein V6N11_006884 [Hibiscus sabdariffa]|uniref:RRM domain-containing protein n=1 Tax=Hibiscus sabdariffa TaxID=183260 RepID=A0ABR2RS57_9ROSI